MLGTKTNNLKSLLIGLAAFMYLVLQPLNAFAATTVSISSPTTGSSETGTSFTVSGTATPHRNITVEINGTVEGTTTSDSSGDWSVDVIGQSPGTKSIEVTAGTQHLYTNVLNTGDFSASKMSIINTLNGEEEDSFSIFAGGLFPITWKPNPAFTQAYGVAPLSK